MRLITYPHTSHNQSNWSLTNRVWNFLYQNTFSDQRQMSQKLRWVLRMPCDVFWVAVWKSSGAQISSNLVFLENSGCLVSIGSNLMPFGAVEISCLERFKTTTCNENMHFIYIVKLSGLIKCNVLRLLNVHHSGRDLYFYSSSFL